MMVLMLCVAAFAAPVAEATWDVYRTNCLSCHGENGDGRGPAAAVLRPPPVDFTDPAFWSSRTPEQLRASIEAVSPSLWQGGDAALDAASVDALMVVLQQWAPQVEEEDSE